MRMRPRMAPGRTVACCGILLGCAASPAERPAPAPSGAAVTADDIEPNPSRSIEVMLQSKCPQCIITRAPSGRIAIGIRSRSSLRGPNYPLYVIDGVPLDAEPNGELPDLVNVHDIATITLLTDPTSTSMYGARGANGVVLITLKR